jgi:hypothetical protein
LSLAALSASFRNSTDNQIEYINTSLIFVMQVVIIVDVFILISNRFAKWNPLFIYYSDLIRSDMAKSRFKQFFICVVYLGLSTVKQFYRIGFGEK